MELTPVEIEQLQELCQWIWLQPCHAAYSSSILQALPHLSRWVSSDRTIKQKRKGWIYYQVGYGWRVDKKWIRKSSRIGIN
jgi:hypothetical protein